MRSGRKSASLYLLAAAGLAIALAGCKGPGTGGGMIDWLGQGNLQDQQRYGAIDQITAANVASLKLDWELEMPDAMAFVSAPLVIDGVLYFSGDRAIVRAVDAKTGKLLWTFNPEIHKHAPRQIAQAWNSNRGIAYLDGRIFLGASDGRLIAIDAASGKQLWATRTFPAGEHKAITGAPLAFGKLVLIGFGGAEYNSRGYVTAYDSETGKQVWRFYTVPGAPGTSDGAASDPVMDMARATWHGEWWKKGGGGTVWNAMTYDADFDQVLIGVGNGDPWNYEERSEGKGDNLFLGSILALDAQTGAYKWHYQMTPGERWDYKSTMDMVLTDLDIDGVRRKVVMQAPTNCFFYVLDRENGKLLSSEKYGKTNWAEKIDLQTGRPVLTDAARYEKNGPSTLWPSPFGCHNWQPMSYSPATGLVYIPDMEQPGSYQMGTEIKYRPDFMTNHSVVVGFPHVEDGDGLGGLLAWDPVQQKARWKVTHESFWNGGTLVTQGGVVFQGLGSGEFAAFDAGNGHKLWSVDTQRGITAAPVTYAVDGVQHVAVLVGYGGLASFGLPFMVKYGYKYKDAGIRLLSFSLEGKKQLQRLTTRQGEFEPADPGDAPIDAGLAAEGFALYHRSSCAVCHGVAVTGSGSNGPDLRESAAAMDYDSLRSIVKDGILLPNGMPQFADLSDHEVRAINEYLRQTVRDIKSQ